MDSSEKKPLGFCENARSLTYASNVGGPAITVPDVSGFKQTKLVEAQHFVDQRYDEIKRQYEELLDLAEINELVYNSEYRFVPIIGQVYYVWEREDNTTWLSMTGPKDKPLWNGECLGAFKLNSYSVWIRVEE